MPQIAGINVEEQKMYQVQEVTQGEPRMRIKRIVTIALSIALFAATLSPFIIATATVSAADSVSSIGVEANKAEVLSAITAVLNGQDVAAAETLFADNFRRFDAETPNVALGRKGMSFLTSYYRSVFPDLKYTVEDVIAEGDRVVTRWTATGTHLGAYGLHAPTGNQVTWAGTTVWQLLDGKIVTVWVSQDMMGLTRQLDGNAEASWGPAYHR